MKSPFGGRILGGRPKLSPAVAWLIGVSLGVFLLWVFATKASQVLMARWLVLTPASLLEGHVWKLVTAPLLNPNGLAFVFDLLMMWAFVPVMEHHFGTRRFVGIAVTASVVANLVSAGVGLLLGGASRLTPIAGLSPLVFAIIAAYGVVYAHQQVQFFGVVPIKGRVLAIGIAAFVALSTLLDRAWVVGAGYFAGMAVGWAVAGGASPDLWLAKWRRARLRRRYTVINGGSERPPKKKQQWLN